MGDIKKYKKPLVFIRATRLFYCYALLLFSFQFTLIFCHGKDVRPISKFQDKRHIGRWRGASSYGMRGGQLNLYDNGFAFFSANGHSFGGSKLSDDGGLLYEIDYKAKPIKLDLIGINAKYQEVQRIKIILSFLNKNKIKACTFMNSISPLRFSNNKCHQVLLTRIK